jgi:hypothetical protein
VTDLRAAIIIEVATDKSGTMPERLHRSVAARRSAATKISNEANGEAFTPLLRNAPTVAIHLNLQLQLNARPNSPTSISETGRMRGIPFVGFHVGLVGDIAPTRVQTCLLLNVVAYR